MANPMVQVNVRVPPEMHEWILAEAQASGGNVTSVVLLALHTLRERNADYVKGNK